jgi:non-specific serine/threonine protein kinase
MELDADLLGGALAARDDERRLTFARQVREALVHLNDLATLRRLPLVQFMSSEGCPRGMGDAEALQQALHEAIGALRPSVPTDSMAPVGRSYHLLTLRYVAGLDVASVLPKLALARSEYYRDHQRALDELSAFLWERWHIVTYRDRLRPRTNLPAPVSSFVGREREIAEITRLLGTTRLLTLTGIGGCGKTRLALRVAADLLDAYPDGVWVVELASLNDPALVPQTVAFVLGRRERTGQTIVERLTTYLEDKDLLLLLDNSEHLLDAAAQLVHTLLRSCPRLRIFTTSRAALGLAGEMIWRVPSLPLPPTSAARVDDIRNSEAVRLFVERAQAMQPSFALTTDSAPTVVQICRRLDGIPLAIELAASRVRVLNVEQIARRLDDRFRFLTGASRGVLPRQQTLQATLDWSYALLAEPERALFRRLSVFAGGFGLEAAEAMCSEVSGVGSQVSGEGTGRTDTRYLTPNTVLDLLTQLVDKSLVLVEEGTGEARYRLLETIRQYGWERLVETGEASAARDRHRDWYVALAESARAELRGARLAEWLDRLEAEHDNLRAALEWSEQSGALVSLRLVGSIWRFWQQRGYHAEGRRRLAAALTSGSAADYRQGKRDRARALIGAGVLAYDQGDFRIGRLFVEESLDLFRQAEDVPGVVRALRTLGLCLLGAGEPVEQVRPLLEESLSQARAMGDQRDVGIALLYLGYLAAREREGSRAARLLAEALALFRQIGDLAEVSDTLRTRGFFAWGRGDFPQACRDLEEALEIARRIGQKRGAGLTLLALGCLVLEEGDRSRAAELLEEGARLLEEIAVPGVYQILGHLGLRAVQRGQTDRGIRLLATADGRPENGLFPILLPSTHPTARAAAIAAARAALGEETFAAAWAEGQAMTLEQALDYALTAEAD